MVQTPVTGTGTEKKKPEPKKEYPKLRMWCNRIPICFLIMFYMFTQINIFVGFVMFMEGNHIIDKSVAGICDNNPNSILSCP